jgi:glutathione S-transferase
MTGHTDSHAPYLVYAPRYSLCSNKLETYLRYKGVDYTPVIPTPNILRTIRSKTGFYKVPAAQTADDKWLFDTTNMLHWFEQQYPQAPIYPGDQALRFIALLLEDYADEWLWRIAMWWRWEPPAARWATGRLIVTEAGVPRSLRRLAGFNIGRRQRKEWLWDDGMTQENSDDVRDQLYRELEFLEPLLEQQPFLLGSHPSYADFGYAGPFLNHFCHEPEPLEVLRRHGPNTTEWAARMWNAKASRLPAEQQWQWPEADYWAPLLERIARDYLPYLHQNALAFREGESRFDYSGKTFTFKNTKTTDYRVYCRQVLQKEFASLSPEDQQRVTELLTPCGGLDSLHADGLIDSGMAAMFVLPRDPSPEEEYEHSLMGAVAMQPRN